jgi:hypothetical protein
MLEKSMRWSHVLVALSWLAIPCFVSGAVDYSKIDRAIKKEPAYQSKSPKYALLLFGPEAAVRVWVVLDGETIYLDRNADGDLTGTTKRFAKDSDCKDIEIADPDGKTRYLIKGVSHFTEGKPETTQLMVSVTIQGPITYQQYCDVAVQDSPQKANLAHFHGPLTMEPRKISWKLPPKLALRSGENPVDLPGNVGTMNEKYGCWVVVRTHNSKGGTFPKEIFPVVDVEFPPKTPGGAVIKKRYPLAEFC